MSRSFCDTLGLAHSGQMCEPSSSCAIVEDNGLSAAFTIAHELGHILGIPHDDEDKCKKYYASPEGRQELERHRPSEMNVMSRMIDFNSDMWSWSPCSRHFITEFLDSGAGDCLLDKNGQDIRNHLGSSSSMLDYSEHSERHFRRSFNTNKLAKEDIKKMKELSFAGSQYNANEQCQLAYGNGSRVCTDMPKCKRLWCTSGSDTGCRTHHMPWADGTMCGQRKWCLHGECVDIHPQQYERVDGGWGQWSDYTECSLECGGGVKQSKRRCDSPK